MSLEIVQGSSGPDESRGGASARGAATKANGLKALVVDDELSICKAMQRALSSAGYDVVVAQSGESALAVIRAEHVDVMLVDLRIPDMRGDIVFELAAATQPHLAYQTLFMTGDITDNAQALICACRCHYLQKPFDLNDLTDAMAAVAPKVRDRLA